jgi:hypothetical protein
MCNGKRRSSMETKHRVIFTELVGDISIPLLLYLCYVAPYMIQPLVVDKPSSDRLYRSAPSFIASQYH